MPTLYLIPTPIGNLADMSYRAVECLQNADAILCEDTRTSGKLLKHYQIKKPLIAYHQHNEHKKAEQLLFRIQAGEDLALITDAGTPGISDPGYLLVRLCIQNEVEVQCLPGATALIPALINSGLPCEKFVFEGFLPLKKGRQSRLQLLEKESRTMIFYESPHRLLKTLAQFQSFFGERRAAVCRELTKIHEESIRGTFEEIIAYYEQHTLKGELVIVVEGNKGKTKK